MIKIIDALKYGKYVKNENQLVPRSIITQSVSKTQEVKSGNEFFELSREIRVGSMCGRKCS